MKDLPLLALPDKKEIGMSGLYFTEPVQEPVKPERPPFLETAKAVFKETNLLYYSARLLADADNPYRDLTVEDGYDPFPLAEQVKEEDRGRLIRTRSRAEGEAMLQRILTEYKDQETIQNSGWMTVLTTSLGAGLLSPENWIPIGSMLKYASLGKGALMGAVHSAKSVIPTAVFSNAVIQTAKETGNMQDFFHNTIFESAIGVGIGGALGAYATAGVKKNVKLAKGLFDAVKDDVGIAVELAQDGSFTGKLKAYDLKDVGAMQSRVPQIQQYLDEFNILENNPYSKKFFGLMAPVVKGLTSEYKTVRDFFDGLFPHNFHVAGNDLSRVRNASAWSQKRQYHTIFEGLKMMQTQTWLESQGKGTGVLSTVGAKISEARGKLSQTELQFNEEVAKSYRRGFTGGSKEANEMAKTWHDELVDKVLTVFKERYPDFKEHELTNISKFLSRIYNKAKIQENPKAFMDALYKAFKKVNDNIIDITKPLTDLEQTILTQKNSFKSNAERMKSLDKKSAEYLTLKETQAQLKRDIAESRKAFKQIDRDIQRRIASGEIDATHLYDAPKLTQAQIDRIETLNKPIKELQKALKDITNEMNRLGTGKALKEVTLKNTDKIVDEMITGLPEKLEKKGLKGTIAELEGQVNQFKSELADFKEAVPKPKAQAVDKAQLKEIEDKIARIKEKEAVQLQKVSGSKTTQAKRKAEITAQAEKEIAVLKTKQKALQQQEQQGLVFAERVERQRQTGEFEKQRASLEAKIEAGQQLVQFLRKKGKGKLSAEELSIQTQDIKKALKGFASKTQKGFKQAKAEIRQKKASVKAELAQAKLKLKSQLLDIEDKDILIFRKDMPDAVGLRDPKRAELRRVMTDDELKQSAKDVLDKVTQMDEEQLAGAIFDQIQGKGTDIFKNRGLLVNDEVLEPFLVNDMNVIMGLFTEQMSRRIALADFFKKYGFDVSQGQENLIKFLKSEFDEKRAKLLAENASPEAFTKLSKRFEENKKLLEDGYATFMGTYANKKTGVYRVANALKQIAAGTLLGNMPILSIPDFFAPLFKFTYKEYFEDGVQSLVSNYSALLKSGKVEREAFQDIGVGVDVMLGKSMQAISGYGTQYMPQTAFERYLQNMVNLSHNFSLANYIADKQQVMTGFMSQAHSIRLARKVVNGEALTAKEIARLDELRLPLSKGAVVRGDKTLSLAEVIIEQVEKHGERLDNGGYVANWHLWDKEAFEARIAFGASIDKEVRMIISRPNPADMPFWMQNNLASLFMQFTSWSFGATMNYTMPLMTQFDRQKLIGSLHMIGASALVDPLRQLAKGEEVDLSPKAIITSMMVNSGFLTHYMDIFQRLNQALDLPVLREFQGSRFRRKDFWSAVASPSAGVVNDLFTLVSAVANGDITQGDAHKALRYTFPMFYNWMTRYPINKAIEATGLPEKREPRR